MPEVLAPKGPDFGLPGPGLADAGGARCHVADLEDRRRRRQGALTLAEALARNGPDFGLPGPGLTDAGGARHGRIARTPATSPAGSRPGPRPGSVARGSRRMADSRLRPGRGLLAQGASARPRTSWTLLGRRFLPTDPETRRSAPS